MKNYKLLLPGLISTLTLLACRAPIRTPVTPTATPDNRTAAADANKRISLNLPTQKNRRPATQPSFASKPANPSVDLNKRVSINLPKQNTSQQSPSPEPSAIKLTKIKFAKTLPGSWFDLKLTGIEFSNNLESENPLAPKPQKDHVYMFFKASVTNTSEQERTFSIAIHNLKLITQEAEEIKMFPSYLYREQFLSGKIAAGKSLTGEFGFEVNKNLEQLTLKADPFLENKKISIEVDGPAKHLSD